MWDKRVFRGSNYASVSVPAAQVAETKKKATVTIKKSQEQSKDNVSLYVKVNR